MHLSDVGQAGLKGWRAKVGDAVAPAVARRSPLREEQVRAAVGAIFLTLATVYVAGSIRELVRQST